MYGRGQLQQTQAEWSSADNCYVCYSNNGQRLRYISATRQWVPFVTQQQPSRAQGLSHNQSAEPRNPPPQPESLSNVPSGRGGTRWSQRSVSDASEYTTFHQRTPSGASTSPVLPRQYDPQQALASQGPSYGGQNTLPNPRGPGSFYPQQLGLQATALPFQPKRLVSQSSASGPNPTEQAQQAGSSQPKGYRRRPHKEIQGTAGESEQLDDRFKKRQKHFFARFRVFMMLWSQPADDRNTTSITSKEMSRDSRFRQPIFTKIRYFIVVKEGDDKCLCVPIVTYQGQGVGKNEGTDAGNSVIKNEHAIVYTGDRAPDPRPSEIAHRLEKPMRTPIQVRSDGRGDKLDKMSRIDYGRVYTIEKNVKARAFGWINEKSRKDLDYDFLNVFMGEEGYKDWHKKSQNQGLLADGHDEVDDDSDDASEEESDEERSGKSDDQAGSSQPAARGKAPVRDLRIAETRTGATKIATTRVQMSSQNTVATTATAAIQYSPGQYHGQHHGQYGERNLPTNTRPQAIRGPAAHAVSIQSRTVEGQSSDDETDDSSE